jgi:hypothetical protein
LRSIPNPKTYILDDLPTDVDTLDFTPCVETLVDVCKIASTPLTIGVFGIWSSRCAFRGRNFPDSIYRNSGFRIAVSPTISQ